MKVAMMTDRNLARFSSAHRKRDKHPARSARILTTGFSIAAVLGVTAGYSHAATKSNPVFAEGPNNFQPELRLPLSLDFSTTTTTTTYEPQPIVTMPAVPQPAVPQPAITVPASQVPKKVTKRVHLQIPVTPNAPMTSSGSK